jgi:predicted small lipoprotein YifL
VTIPSAGEFLLSGPRIEAHHHCSTERNTALRIVAAQRCREPKRMVAALVAAALLSAVAGCSRPAPAPPAAVPAATVATSSFGGTDLAWIEINIAMNDQVLPLLALVPTRSDDAALTALSAQVQADATAELTTLRRLHGAAGLPAENPHEGMLMPGLVPAEAVTEATSLSGPDFDKAVREQLAGYLRQSHRLAEDEQQAGTDPTTLELATRTAQARASALKRLAG